MRGILQLDQHGRGRQEKEEKGGTLPLNQKLSERRRKTRKGNITIRPMKLWKIGERRERGTLPLDH